MVKTSQQSSPPPPPPGSQQYLCKSVRTGCPWLATNHPPRETNKNGFTYGRKMKVTHQINIQRLILFELLIFLLITFLWNLVVMLISRLGIPMGTNCAHWCQICSYIHMKLIFNLSFRYIDDVQKILTLSGTPDFTPFGEFMISPIHYTCIYIIYYWICQFRTMFTD